MLASDEAGTLADELSYILQNVAKSISIQNANGNIPFRLSDQNGKIVFQDIHFAVQESLAPSLTAADRGHRIVEIEGRYYIQTAQPLTLAGTVFYIENYRDITPVDVYKRQIVCLDHISTVIILFHDTGQFPNRLLALSSAAKVLFRYDLRDHHTDNHKNHLFTGVFIAISQVAGDGRCV